MPFLLQFFGIGLLVILPLRSQAVTFTYTDTQTGNELQPLGFEVPLPVDSLTPIDGFRSYESLHLRHQQLSERSDNFAPLELGQTINGRTIWSYQLSDSDNLTVSGALEGSALINGGIHAREWQSPEALTGYMERLFAERDQQHLAQYLLENLNLILIPVLNIDGFLQTQRYATQVSSSIQQPRDGRMRRKNMRDVDEVLNTPEDNMQGIDLNRNNAAFWATNSQRSSDNVDSIVHHGSGPASEPETQALQLAAQFANEDRLRFYIDTHSYTQIYFTPFTDNERRNSITEHYANVMRAANNYKYEYGPSAAGSGIGATDEYFANTYQIPAYTLEIEPLNGAADYGGLGVSHDGFILPNSEVARMRDETALATLTGLYAAAEVPLLMAIEIWDSQQNTLIIAQNWQATDDATRVMQISNEGELQAQTAYQLKLIFNKPMRQLVNDLPVGFAQLSEELGIELKLSGLLNGAATQWPIDTSLGSWLAVTASDQGFSRYKTDTFTVPVSLDVNFDWQALSLLAIETTTTDMVGQKLDTNPATIVDWKNGAWSGYEDSLGNLNTDNGGVDVAMRLIDDGSELYQSNTQAPNPIVDPPANSSQGGGAVFWLLVGLLGRLFLVQKQNRRVKYSPMGNV